MTAKIIRLEPGSHRRAGVLNRPSFRVPLLTLRFLNRIWDSVEDVDGYRWVGGGRHWRLDLSFYGIDYVDPTRTEPGYWVLCGGGLDDTGKRVADPAEAIAFLRDHDLIPDLKADGR